MFNIVEKSESVDGSAKYLLESKKDKGRIEAVFFTKENSDGKSILCLSSQVGCAVGCSFCATGKCGFMRNLSREELESQANIVRKNLGRKSKSVYAYTMMGANRLWTLLI